MVQKARVCAERTRLVAEQRREANWKRWGPYLSERQWGTVREDYSAQGESWTYFPHEQARSRAYRWGEDGLLGICDRQCRLCFALALWNERDPFLKERLFGLTGPQGNHGEDVKELYYYLDSTPTHSYMKALYKYPQRAYPYTELIEGNAARGYREPELELLDLGVFDEDRYFDVAVEYAKASPNDILIRISITNRGPRAARLHLLPTLWFRNTWAWGRTSEGYLDTEPRIERVSSRLLKAEHPELGNFHLAMDRASSGAEPQLLFTNNESNVALLFGRDNDHTHVKDGFNAYLVGGDRSAISAEGRGTKAAAHYQLDVAAGAEVVVQMRLAEVDGSPPPVLGEPFQQIFDERLREADRFYREIEPGEVSADERNVLRQSYASLLWTKQFYHYVVDDWLRGDATQPAPPVERARGRNHQWARHLYNRDVISMPDKWEYPWYAAWDLAFHMLPFAVVDPHFAKGQIELFLREWYMHPNGQLPAYEFALSDVNPPVHAWAAWRVYKMSATRGRRDKVFLSHVFQKLLMNFTWWVNRKDHDGNNIFSGGFLGLDNIGLFDRSRPLPTGGELEQADGTAWMAFYASTMLSIALELARDDPAGEDLASKFFEHFIAIADSINSLCGGGLWDEQDGFYYDRLLCDHHSSLLRIRSMVGIIPLFATEVLDKELLESMPGFQKRMRWFRSNHPEIAERVIDIDFERRLMLMALVPKDRLLRVLHYVLDEDEFLSPYGVRSLSKLHAEQPYVFTLEGGTQRVDYLPGESDSGMFGGNSNWRGPVWFPLNYLLIEALERYHHFYPDVRLACPTGSDQMMSLQEIADELSRRLSKLFLRDEQGRRAAHGDESRYVEDPHFRDLVLFYEYFDGDNGRGLGASHQTGWTSLVSLCIEQLALRRSDK